MSYHNTTMSMHLTALRLRTVLLCASILFFALAWGIGTARAATTIELPASLTALLKSTAAASTCHTITSTLSTLPAGYGSPLNFSSLLPRAMFTVTCDSTTGVKAHVEGDEQTYTYQYGFQRMNGAWKPFRFTGASVNGAWVVGDAEATLPDQVSDGGKIIAYTCQLVGGVWKCGCRDKACLQPYWQLQTYSKSGSLQAGAPTMSSSAYGPTEEGVQRISSYMVKTGAPFTLSGAGFSSKDNDVYFDEKLVISNSASISGTSLVLNVPDTVTPGKYEVTVKADGKTLPGSQVLWVQEEDAPAPNITNVSPSLVKQGGKVTLTGVGFSEYSNDVVTTFGVVDAGGSEDGTTLTFTYMPFDEEVVYRDMDGNVVDYEKDIFFMVVNAGGSSNQAQAKLDM